MRLNTLALAMVYAGVDSALQPNRTHMSVHAYVLAGGVMRALRGGR